MVLTFVQKFPELAEKLRQALKENPDLKTGSIISKYADLEPQSIDYRCAHGYLSRYRKTLLDQHEGIFKATDSVDVSPQDVKHMWIKTKEGVSAFVKNPEFVEKEEKDFESIVLASIERMKEHSPKLKSIRRKPFTKDAQPKLLVVDPADCHIGKLSQNFATGEEYNEQLAVKRVLEGVRGVLGRASVYNVEKILLVGGNDILHIDTPKRTTTAGTPQDTSGSWYSNFMFARQLYIDIIEEMLQVADVHFVFNPSNHDYMSGFFLANVIETYFRHSKNVTFDCNLRHRKAFHYYNNLIGTTHGDGAKMEDLPLLMATEFPIAWSKTKHRYIYTHHIHHKTSKDFSGITVESLRSPSAADEWHHKSGYQHAPKAIEGFVHDRVHGQIARYTHLF